MKTLVAILKFTVEISNYPAFFDFYGSNRKMNFLFGFFISKFKIRAEFMEVLREFF